MYPGRVVTVHSPNCIDEATVVPWPQCRVPEVLLHSAGAPSRGAALLVGCILPVCALLAPCAPGASPPSVLKDLSADSRGSLRALRPRMDPQSVPGLVERFGLRFPGDPPVGVSTDVGRAG